MTRLSFEPPLGKEKEFQEKGGGDGWAYWRRESSEGTFSVMDERERDASVRLVVISEVRVRRTEVMAC